MKHSENVAKLEQILEGKYITPVYQPIVSLRDGTVFGYEALSRIANETLAMGIDEMFKTADRINKAWELEALCRARALKHSVGIDETQKLFINVNPNIIHDTDFKEGFTRNRLNKLGISSHSIIFEITERVTVKHRNLFFESVDHYKSQDYGIAIDDVGSGYSGLNIIVDVRPCFIKLDMHLIRNIHKDHIKFCLCKALTDFCKGVGIKLIAEGIETDEELLQLISLGVDYGQGFLLGKPKETIEDISLITSQKIKNMFHQKKVEQKVS